MKDVKQRSSPQESPPPRRRRRWDLGAGWQEGQGGGGDLGAGSQEGRGRRSAETPVTYRGAEAAGSALLRSQGRDRPARAIGLVDVDVLIERGVDYGNIESAHQYADAQELLPLIADDAYLRTVLTYELAGGDPDEPIKLSRVADDVALRELVCALQDARSSFAGGKFAESLSLLYKTRADRLRHERLMAKLRGVFLPYLAGLIVLLLGLLALAIFSGGNRWMLALSPGGPSWLPSEPPERSAASWRRHSNSETPSSWILSAALRPSPLSSL